MNVKVFQVSEKKKVETERIISIRKSALLKNEQFLYTT